MPSLSRDEANREEGRREEARREDARLDERRRAEDRHFDDRAAEARADARRAEREDDSSVAKDLRESYERGRRDERSSRRRHPIGMTLLFLAAAVGVIILVLAAVNGSFSGAGQVVDSSLSAATNR